MAESLTAWLNQMKAQAAMRSKNGQKTYAVTPVRQRYLGNTGYGDDGKLQPSNPTHMIQTPAGRRALHEGEDVLRNGNGTLDIIPADKVGGQAALRGMPGYQEGATDVIVKPRIKEEPTQPAQTNTDPTKLNVMSALGRMSDTLGSAAARYNAQQQTFSTPTVEQVLPDVRQAVTTRPKVNTSSLSGPMTITNKTTGNVMSFNQPVSPAPAGATSTMQTFSVDTSTNPAYSAAATRTKDTTLKMRDDAHVLDYTAWKAKYPGGTEEEYAKMKQSVGVGLGSSGAGAFNLAERGLEPDAALTADPTDAQKTDIQQAQAAGRQAVPTTRPEPVAVGFGNDPSGYATDPRNQVQPTEEPAPETPPEPAPTPATDAYGRGLSLLEDYATGGSPAYRAATQQYLDQLAGQQGVERRVAGFEAAQGGLSSDIAGARQAMLRAGQGSQMAQAAGRAAVGEMQTREQAARDLTSAAQFGANMEFLKQKYGDEAGTRAANDAQTMSLDTWLQAHPNMTEADYNMAREFRQQELASGDLAIQAQRLNMTTAQYSQVQDMVNRGFSLDAVNEAIQKSGGTPISQTQFDSIYDASPIGERDYGRKMTMINTLVATGGEGNLTRASSLLNEMLPDLGIDFGKLIEGEKAEEFGAGMSSVSKLIASNMDADQALAAMKQEGTFKGLGMDDAKFRTFYEDLQVKSSPVYALTAGMTDTDLTNMFPGATPDQARAAITKLSIFGGLKVNSDGTWSVDTDALSKVSGEGFMANGSGSGSGAMTDARWSSMGITEKWNYFNNTQTGLQNTVKQGMWEAMGMPKTIDEYRQKATGGTGGTGGTGSGGTGGTGATGGFNDPDSTVPEKYQFAIDKTGKLATYEGSGKLTPTEISALTGDYGWKEISTAEAPWLDGDALTVIDTARNWFTANPTQAKTVGLDNQELGNNVGNVVIIPGDDMPYLVVGKKPLQSNRYWGYDLVRLSDGNATSVYAPKTRNGMGDPVVYHDSLDDFNWRQEEFTPTWFEEHVAQPYLGTGGN